MIRIPLCRQEFIKAPDLIEIRGFLFASADRWVTRDGQRLSCDEGAALHPSYGTGS